MPGLVWVFSSVILLWVAGVASSAAPAKTGSKTAPAKSVKTKPGASKPVPQAKAGGSKSAGHGKAVASKSAAKAKPPSPSVRYAAKRRSRGPAYGSWRYGQQQPKPERIAEIERALAGRGYLSDPDDKWDQKSAEALKRFQIDQNLNADGKLSSLSLIGLGLGPNRTPPPPAVRPELPPTAPAAGPLPPPEPPQAPQDPPDPGR